MKYKKTIIIMVIAIFIAASPYFSGYIAEKRIRFMAAKVIKLTRHKLKLQKYQLNWLTTQLTFITKPGKLVTIHIKHGPLISTSKGVKLSTAYVDYNGQELRKLFLDSNIQWSEDAVVEINFPFIGNSIFTIKAERLKTDNIFTPKIFNFLETFQLSVKNIDFLFPISIDGQIKGAELKFEDAKLKVNNVNVSLNKFRYESTYRMPFNGLKIGTDMVRLERLEVRSVLNVGVVVKNLNYSFVSDVVGALVQYKIALNTGQVKIKQHKIESLIYSLLLNNLDDQALVDLRKMEGKLYRISVGSAAPAFERLMAKALTRFFSTSPAAKSSLDIKFPSGNLKVLISAGSKPALFKGKAYNFISALFKNGRVDVKASADKKALFEMLQILQELKGTASLTQTIDVSTITSPLLESSFIDISLSAKKDTGKKSSDSVNSVTVVLPVPTLSVQQRIELSVRKTIKKYLLTKIIVERDDKYHASLKFKDGGLLLNDKKEPTYPTSE